MKGMSTFKVKIAKSARYIWGIQWSLDQADGYLSEIEANVTIIDDEVT